MKPLRRRRFITIAAAAAGLPLLSTSGASARTASTLRVWTGAALGADAMLQINHPDPAQADRLIEISLAEVARLERVFSLYRPDSALSRLNRDGVLDAPPTDLVRLLGECETFSSQTGGAFDVTVQPLWDVYADHFGRPDADPSGPPAGIVAAALARVGHDRIEVDPRRIRFMAPGMSVTLNGIAQGYVTDRVVERLKEAGITHALVDMGETRAIGAHPAGSPWQVGIADPKQPGRSIAREALQDRAIATSGGYGTQFDPAGRFNHIFDPASGRTSWRYQSVSVIAPDATTADALSTAFCLMPPDSVQRLVAQRALRAVLVMDGRPRVVQAAT
jgi:thiamine biosynthesis lipoprotein